MRCICHSGLRRRKVESGTLKEEKAIRSKNGVLPKGFSPGQVHYLFGETEK